MTVLTLVKYQGLGNDFLVALDGQGFDAAGAVLAGREAEGEDLGARPHAEVVAGLARALCERHTGLGSDGVLVLRNPSPGADVRMELRNADGGRAETSGNGLRCFALAVVEAGLVPGPEVNIETDAGVRKAVIGRRDGPGLAEVSVEMGRVIVLRSDPVTDPALPGSRALPWPAWSVQVGNPHLVLLAPRLEGVLIGAAGPTLERRRPGGQNVEVAIYGPEAGELTLLVWERGVGETLACGTGSVAAAAALYSAGIAPCAVRVISPGGSAKVTIAGDDPVALTAELAGPVRRVARIEVDPVMLARSAAKAATR